MNAANAEPHAITKTPVENNVPHIGFAAKYCPIFTPVKKMGSVMKIVKSNRRKAVYKGSFIFVSESLQTVRISSCQSSFPTPAQIRSTLDRRYFDRNSLIYRRYRAFVVVATCLIESHKIALSRGIRSISWKTACFFHEMNYCCLPMKSPRVARSIP